MKGSDFVHLLKFNADNYIPIMFLSFYFLIFYSH